MEFYADKFNDFCGIAKVIHPQTQKEVYVVYGWFFEDNPFQRENYGSSEVGDSLGFGETKELAMIDAIKNLVEMRRNYDADLEDVKEKLKSIQYCPYGTKESIVVPVFWEDECSKREDVYNTGVHVDWANKSVDFGLG